MGLGLAMMQAITAKLRQACQWLAIGMAFIAGALLAWSLSPDEQKKKEEPKP